MNIHKENHFDWFKALRTQKVLELLKERYYNQSIDGIYEGPSQIARWILLYDANAIDLAYLASDWPTCACGNLCDAIPRRDGQLHEPADLRLRGLGSSFYYAVESEDWNQATDLLQKIEARSVELLKEIYSKK